ncbi:ricin-type beta-trefoil lectin domain protein [Lysobacter sp. CA199]|uniref:ricin-type beta-trefoil lectin domain protein n=1 Tax=Lysobacter sp. CA199 TaxID=3455608 RepID=UPI003F8D6D14
MNAAFCYAQPKSDGRSESARIVVFTFRMQDVVLVNLTRWFDMRSVLLVGALAFMAAGCTSSDSSRTAARTDSFGAPSRSAHVPMAAAGDASVIATPRGLPMRRAGQGVARLPDHGDLVAYPESGKALHDNAYTWHRAGLSEGHAIAAIVGGRLSITTPSGEKLGFRYERHVEHASGDWTWVGRLDNGGADNEAIITFGNRAVFGSIAQPGKPALKLTMRDGDTWLVETDQTRLPAADAADHADDYRIPTAAAAASSSPSANDSPALAATAASDGGTIDLLIGYSNGFATGLGGQSQAVTRLNYLVEVSNQAYVNSQITARLRLVHSMQVNYADSSDNGDTLDKMTGTGSVPVDPAFNALRAARDQYGADLVSLVRKYDPNTQNGCGIAWLIGGGRQPFTVNSAPSGYSVASDGRYQNGSTSYFCRDETLAHELGHNMGAQHDRATASSGGSLAYGAFAYSFGYKVGASGGNFYDIMAYGDSGQTSYRVFSNPRITFCGGFACGVENEADTARTLNQTMPIVATFRATVVPPPPHDRIGWIVGVGGLCLDAAGLGTANGTALQVWNCSGLPHQQWSFANSSGAIVGVASGRALDVIGLGTASGTRVQLWDRSGNSNQAWSFRKMAIVANGGRVLDAAGVSSANQTRMQLWDSYGTVNQIWNYNPVSGELVGMDGKCLDVTGHGTAAGTPVQFWDCSGNTNQKWRLEANGQIVGLGGNCLEVADGRSDNGAPIRMWPCNGLPHQSWAFRGEIRSRASDRCLDDPGFGQSLGSRPHIWDCHGGANQQWTFYWK